MEIDMSNYTCNGCGRYYSIQETMKEKHTWPYCSEERIKKLKDELEGACSSIKARFFTITERDKTIASLRGWITRLRKRESELLLKSIKTTPDVIFKVTDGK